METWELKTGLIALSREKAEEWLRLVTEDTVRSCLLWVDKAAPVGPLYLENNLPWYNSKGDCVDSSAFDDEVIYPTINIDLVDYLKNNIQNPWGIWTLHCTVTGDLLYVESNDYRIVDWERRVREEEEAAEED